MDYRIEALGAFRVAGKEKIVRHDRAFEEVPAFMQEAGGEELFGRLLAVRAEHAPIGGILGVCAEGNWGANESFAYMLGIVTEAALPDGWTARDLPAAEWAVFEAEGGPEALGGLWERLYTEWIASSGYAFADLPAIECYLPPEAGRNELWVPVTRTVG